MPPVDAGRIIRPLLVLWDIDHTLIESRGVGLAIYRRAFLSAFGKPLGELAEVAGRTELDIMAETLRINGIRPDVTALKVLATELIDGYEKARAELASTGRPLPGARESVEMLASRAGVHQAVLTGNLRQVARIKLEVFDLHTHLDLGASAYGDDHRERSRLVTIAQERASARYESTFGVGDIVLVGDTPNDVAAAQTAGVRVVAVASGKSSVAELRAAGAGAVVSDLTDSARVCHLIQGELNDS
ncbi:HAD family hydrolase [Nocardia shimofusensis]|uniref:HAD family hydrolase n=1 Tax=Nocardia shimofusensis TaxID=228596 RepID=UPI00082A2435|nr:haloacid dehalogenase-like hydrolase [Nocardia shimofusensis]